jgi:general secretion pathway protein H
MTLIEVLIVMGLMALVLGAVVVGSGQRSSAKLHHSATMITGAIRVGFSRATATSKTVRLVMDFEANELWLEEGDQPHLVQSKDVSGTGGASPATAAEQQALAESSRILKGPPIPKATFHEIDAMGVAASEPGKGHKKLDGGITFKQVQSQHDDAPRTEGRAYLYFWPGGTTERSAITLRIGPKPREGMEETGTTLTLLVQPLTARVHIKDGTVDMPAPKTDKESSDREDPGAF